MSRPQDFKPGQSGNPNGRPKREWTMAGLLEDALEEQDETGTPYKQIIIKKLRTLAAKGDLVAIKEVNNRMDGMPHQTSDITSDGEAIMPSAKIIGAIKDIYGDKNL